VTAGATPVSLLGSFAVLSLLYRRLQRRPGGSRRRGPRRPARASIDPVASSAHVHATSSNKHPLPSSDTLDWLIGARGGDSYTIHLTNPIQAALSRLHDLQAGKNFSVAARTDPDRAATVTFELTNGDSPQ